MTQLAFRFTNKRFEIPEAYLSWAGGSCVVGAHSIDGDWPWWRPWQPWESR